MGITGRRKKAAAALEQAKLQWERRKLDKRRLRRLDARWGGRSRLLVDINSDSFTGIQHQFSLWGKKPLPQSSLLSAIHFKRTHHRRRKLIGRQQRRRDLTNRNGMLGNKKKTKRNNSLFQRTIMGQTMFPFGIPQHCPLYSDSSSTCFFVVHLQRVSLKGRIACQ